MALVPLPGVLARLKMNQQIRQNHHSILRSQSRNGDETWRNRFRPWLLAACGKISRARLSYHSLLNWLIAASSCSSSTSSQGADTEFFQLEKIWSQKITRAHTIRPIQQVKWRRQSSWNNHRTRPRLWFFSEDNPPLHTSAGISERNSPMFLSKNGNAH